MQVAIEASDCTAAGVDCLSLWSSALESKVTPHLEAKVQLNLPSPPITINSVIRSRRTIPLRSCWPWVSQPLIHFASTSPSLLCCTCLYGATNWAYRWVTAPFAVLFFAVFHWLYFSCSKLGAAIFYASLSSCLRPFPLSRTPPSQVDSLL